MIINICKIKKLNNKIIIQNQQKINRALVKNHQRNK